MTKLYKHFDICMQTMSTPNRKEQCLASDYQEYNSAVKMQIYFLTVTSS